jgi:hypothetical protein
LRYRTFGPRPASAQAFIAVEGILQMLILGIAMANVCDGSRSTNRLKYVIGETVTVGAWIATSFLL